MPGLRAAEWELTKEQKTQRRQQLIHSLVEKMSPLARERFLRDILPTLQQSPANIKSVYDHDYLYRPVRIQQFIEDPYYLGQTLKNDIFDKIKQSLVDLFEGDHFEVVLGGSIGWGKTTAAYIGMTYDIYLVSCLRSPADTFGLIKGTNVSFLNISVNKSQATKIRFGGVFNLIHNSPYFRERFPWDRNVKTELRFPRGVFAYPIAATERAMLGEGVFAAAFDEMNFYAIVEKSKMSPEGGEFNQADALYQRMSRRIRSRMNVRGRLPGHLWMVSSARYPNDFTQNKIAEALSDPSIFVREYAVWDTKPKHFYMPTSFRVEIGDITKRTRILDGTESAASVNQERVISVPEDFRQAFVDDPDGAARDHAGVSILTVRPFITNRAKIADMFKKSDELGLKHPYTDFTVTLQSEAERLLPECLHWIDEPVVNENGRPVLDENKIQKTVRMLHPGPYFAHIDLALGKPDACGFGVAHMIGATQVWRGFGTERHQESRPISRMDLLLQIVAPKYGEINFSAIRALLYALRNLGMQFAMVSFDSWNSADSIQILKNEGFICEVLSVDRDPVAYEEGRLAIYDGRVYCYTHPVLNVELTSVMMDERHQKIDHPPNGKKDLADAFVGTQHQIEVGFANGIGNNWQEVVTVSQEERVDDPLTRQEQLLYKLEHNIPLTPAEFKELE